MLTPLFMALSSVVTGLIVTKKENIAILIYSMFIVSWHLFEVGLETDMVPWFHVLALTGFALFKRIISDKATKGGMYMF